VTKELLQAVLDDPEDVESRRVYADALAAAGDPRGEFIQVQCNLEDRTPADPGWRALAIRDQRLRAKHGEKWMAPLGKLTFPPSFRRGFLEEIHGVADLIVPSIDRLLAREPITRLSLWQLTRAHAAVLATRAGLTRVYRLAIESSELGTRDLGVLFSEPAPRLRSLDLGEVGIDRDGLACLRATLLPQLEELVLGSKRDLEPRELERIVTDRSLRLAKLGLRLHVVGADGARRLTGSLDLPSLTHLDLASSDLGNEDLAVLSANRTFAGLRALCLRNNRLEGAGAVAAIAGLSQLEELDLSGNELGLAGCRALARLALPRLRTLKLSGLVEPEAVIALAAGLFPALTTLDLSQCMIGVAGVEAVCGTAWPLEQLDLWICVIGDDGARALAASRLTRTLRELLVGYSSLTDAGAIAIAAATWPALERLAFRGDPIGEQGARALAASEMPMLRRVSLENTTTPPRALAPLRRRGVEVWFGVR
jgi:uncharacterized protein (TIGR02996 family)